MRIVVLGLAFALLVFTAACGGDNEEIVPLNSGISGRVLAGPQCPVIQAGSPCPDKPIKATMVIVSEAGDERTVKSSEDGAFRIELAPGEYTVKAQPVDDSGFPTPPADQRVTVAADRFTDIQVSYDTGIR